ncbi:MAG: hypothetical protein FPO08_15925 [Geobacter sp.]|nr:MAG: hypothetical protein FPO08_15925 [Geobacter sp.]
MSSIVQYLSAAAVVPWMLAAFRLAGEGRRFGVPAAELALAVQWVAGDPQWAGIAVALALALAADAAGLAGLKRAAAAALLGTVLTAVQLLPTLFFLQETSLGADINALDKVQWAFAPWRTLELFAPGFFGSVSSGAEKWPVFMWLGGLTRSGFEIPLVPSV